MNHIRDASVFFKCSKCGGMVPSGLSVHVVRGAPHPVEIFCMGCAPAHFTPSITEQIEALLGMGKSPRGVTNYTTLQSAVAAAAGDCVARNNIVRFTVSEGGVTVTTDDGPADEDE